MTNAANTAIAGKTMGKIKEIIGAVVDVEFPREAVPKVYDALTVTNGNEQLTLEVQQQLGDGVVRCIAMGVSDGLKRNLTVANTGKPIQVPVGSELLFRATTTMTIR